MDYATASFVFVGIFIIFLIAILSMWQIFNKAGEEGWKAIIPFYNTYLLTKIAGQPVWVFVLLFFPVVNIISTVMVALGLARVFNKSMVFAVFGLILFPFFGYMMLGWGDAEYSASESTE